MKSGAWKEECGLFALWDHEEAAILAHLGLYAIQHRGQEGAGIVSLGEEGCHWSRRGHGLVADVFRSSRLEALKGRAALGHVRYSTAGDSQLANVQPLQAELKSGPLAVAHNGNIVNAPALRKALQQKGSIFQGNSDTECLLHLLAQSGISAHSTEEAFLSSLQESLRQLKGAYSLLLMTQKKLFAMRDPYGFRPLVLGRKQNDHGRLVPVICSESCAFDLIGATYEREIAPGELFSVDLNNQEKSHHFSDREKETSPRRCIFEHVYFSRPDSLVFSQSPYRLRKEMGRALAKENPVCADMVIAVPDSGMAAAVGYSEESGIPFELGIVRNHYVGRTFIEPSQSIRSFGVKMKLNPQRHFLEGKKVVVVDDSLVRGTTSNKIVSLLRQAKVQEVHMRIASPPIKGSCFYGVDTPESDQLIAAHKRVEAICKFIHADSLAYLSLKSLRKIVSQEEGSWDHLPHKGYCAACFDLDYPVEV